MKKKFVKKGMTVFLTNPTQDDIEFINKKCDAVNEFIVSEECTSEHGAILRSTATGHNFYKSHKNIEPTIKGMIDSNQIFYIKVKGSDIESIKRYLNKLGLSISDLWYKNCNYILVMPDKKEFRLAQGDLKIIKLKNIDKEMQSFLDEQRQEKEKEKETPWYENLGKGRWCKCHGWGEMEESMLVISYKKDSDYPFEVGNFGGFEYATPMTKEEVLEYFDD